MQTGSLLECIKGCEQNVYYVLAAFVAGVPMPAVGQIYLCASLERCKCGRHDNVYLEETGNIPWPPENFREVQPPLSIDELLKNEKDILQPSVITFDFAK
jgi:hypothetical protein